MRQTAGGLAGQARTDWRIVTGTIFRSGCCYLIAAAGLRAAGVPAHVFTLVAEVAGIDIAGSPERPGSLNARAAWPPSASVDGGGALALAVRPASRLRRTTQQPPILTVYGPIRYAWCV